MRNLFIFITEITSLTAKEFKLLNPLKAAG